MTKNYAWVWLVSLIMLVTASVILYKKKQAANDLLPVDLRAFNMPDGWGYEILVDKKVYIHQDCIPAINTYKRFSTEADALLIGRKVVEKIKHGQKPSITEKEITESHIRY
ncbi:MAG: DUF4907 domain-containing protein [Chitinophagaceae bacterium]